MRLSETDKELGEMKRELADVKRILELLGEVDELKERLRDSDNELSEKME